MLRYKVLLGALQLFLDADSRGATSFMPHYKSNCTTSYCTKMMKSTLCVAPSPLGESVSTFISADTAPCDDCLKELQQDKRRK